MCKKAAIFLIWLTVIDYRLVYISPSGYLIELSLSSLSLDILRWTLDSEMANWRARLSLVDL